MIKMPIANLRMIESILAAAFIFPGVVFAVETDRITVEDQSTGIVKFRVTSEGNVTGTSLTGTPTDGATISIQQGPTEDNSAVKLAIIDSVGTAKSIFTAGGKLGVGMAAPTSIVHIRAEGVPGTGTISSTGSAVSGAGTLFMSQLRIGDMITASGQTRLVSAIAQNSSLTTDFFFNPAITAGTTFTIQQPILKMVDASGTQNGTYTANGRLGIGTSFPMYQIEIASEAGSPTHLLRVSSPNGAPTFLGRKARGTSATPTAAVSGDTLFRLGGAGYRDSGWGTQTGVITFNATENFGDLAGGTDVRVLTTKNGTSTSVERFRITDSGYMGIGATDPKAKLEVKDGGIRINTVSSVGKPSCNDDARGTFWFTQGATNAKDIVEVCAKDSSNSLGWRTLY